MDTEYHYYYYNVLQDKKGALTERWQALQINPKRLSEINLGFFNKQGHFVQSHGVFMGRIFFYNFIFTFFESDGDRSQKHEFKLEYAIKDEKGFSTLSTGSITFCNRYFHESDIVKLLTRLIPFITDNNEEIINKGFRNEIFDIKIFHLTLESQLAIVNDLVCKLRETSRYVARKDNEFFDDIIISIPQYANRYFKDALYNFCENELGGVISYSELENELIYRQHQYKAWVASYDEKISDYAWDKEKIKFIIYLTTSYEANYCMKKLLLND